MSKNRSQSRFSKILWIFFYFFIFALLLRSSFGYLDPDLGWHLKVGQEIVQTGAAADINHYNYTFTGHWVDHEWLSNVLVYEVYSHLGYIVLSVLFALLIVGVLVILNIWVRRVYPKVSPTLIIIFQLLGVIGASPHLGVRIQESGLLFLTLILLIIYHYNKQRNWRWLLAFTPIMYLWACLHASFLIGFVIFFGWTSVKIMEKIFFRYYRQAWLDFSGLMSWREIIIFSAAALLSLAATFFTPYKLKLYSFLGGYQDNFYRGHIQEWLPQSDFPFQYRQLLYLALVLIAVIFYFYYSRGDKRRWRLDLWTLGLTALLVILSFSARRHFPLMFVGTFIFVIGVFSHLFNDSEKEESAGGGWLGKNWLRVYVLVCLGLAALFQLVSTNFTSQPFLSYDREYPVAAVEFLKARPQDDSKRLFNQYVWGGYLIWTWPERLLFIDGRLPQVAFGGHTFLEEYLDFFNKKTDIAKKLNDYQIGLVLISARDEATPAKKWERIFFSLRNQDLVSHNYLRAYLSGSRDWRIIYQDQTAVIYERFKRY